MSENKPLCDAASGAPSPCETSVEVADEFTPFIEIILKHGFSQSSRMRHCFYKDLGFAQGKGFRRVEMDLLPSYKFEDAVSLYFRRHELYMLGEERLAYGITWKSDEDHDVALTPGALDLFLTHAGDLGSPL